MTVYPYINYESLKAAVSSPCTKYDLKTLRVLRKEQGTQRNSVILISKSYYSSLYQALSLLASFFLRSAISVPFMARSALEP